MHEAHWLECDLCKCEWIGHPYREDGYTEKCPECNSEEFYIGKLHRAPLGTLWLVLLVPNFMFFC